MYCSLWRQTESVQDLRVPQTQGEGGAFFYYSEDKKSVLTALQIQDTFGIRLENHLLQLTFMHFRENKL